MTAIAKAKVLIVATDRFEESELFGPREALLDAGATVVLASDTTEPILATVIDEPGRTIRPDMLIGDVDPADYDALILPGGVGNPDKLRMNDVAVGIVRAFHAAGKPVAAICHGPWMLVEADVLRGRTATAWPSIRTDLRNAGATVIDRDVVVDGNLITSRQPDDVPAFNKAVIAAIEAA